MIKSLSLLYILLWSGAAFALNASGPALQARDLLNQMIEAGKSQNYDGTFVYIRGDQVTSMRIIHKTDAAGEHERIIALNGPQGEIIRSNREVTCYFPDKQAVVTDRTLPPRLLTSAMLQPVERITDHYSFAILGQERVADFPATIVEVRPQSADRYGYRLWIAQDSHLLLKSNVIDNRGNVLEQILFTSVAVPAVLTDDMLKPGFNGQGYKWYTTEAKKDKLPTDKDKWQIGWLPSGFAMLDEGVHALAASKGPVNHMVFSDGLATVSVFVEKLKGIGAQREGSFSHGVINTYSTVASGHQITVVGAIPAQTVYAIAASVSLSH